MPISASAAVLEDSRRVVVHFSDRVRVSFPSDAQDCLQFFDFKGDPAVFCPTHLFFQSR